MGLGKALRNALLIIIVMAGIILGAARAWASFGSFARLSSPFALTQTQSPLPLNVSVPTAPALQQYWQAGVLAGPAAQHATAMRTTIRTRIPHAVADNTTDYFWIGAYLADGSFIQAGYAVPWYDRSPHWFYCSFTPTGAKGPCDFGAPNSAGPDQSWHSYALQSAPTSAGALWTVTVDSRAVATFPATSGTTGTHTPGVYIEQSAFTPHAPINDLGPSAFAPALEIQTVTHPTFFAAPHARASYSAPGTCPTYGIGVAGFNDLMLGNGIACPPDGANLW